MRGELTSLNHIVQCSTCRALRRRRRESNGHKTCVWYTANPLTWESCDNGALYKATVARRMHCDAAAECETTGTHRHRPLLQHQPEPARRPPLHLPALRCPSHGHWCAARAPETASGQRPALHAPHDITAPTAVAARPPQAADIDRDWNRRPACLVGPSGSKSQLMTCKASLAPQNSSVHNPTVPSAIT